MILQLISLLILTVIEVLFSLQCVLFYLESSAYCCKLKHLLQLVVLLILVD